MTKSTKRLASLILVACLFNQLSGNTIKVLADELDGQSLEYQTTNEDNIDTVDPVINSIEANKNSIVIGDTLEVYIDATDEGSGIKDVYLSYNVGLESKSKKAEYNEQLKEFLVSIPITEEMGLKNLVIHGASATDKKDNYVYENTSIGTYHIPDLNGEVDKEGITLENLTYPDKSYIGEKFEISVEAYDNLSGVGEIRVSLDFNGKGISKDMIYDESSNTYKITLDITEDMLNSNIQIDSIYTYDNSGNYWGMSINKFIPILSRDAVEDTEAPKLSSVTFDKEKVKVGDTIKAYIEASDDISGIALVKARINFGTYYGHSLDFVYDKDLNKYVAQVTVSKEYENEKIQIADIEIYDNYGNRTFVEDGGVSALVVDENGNYNEVPIINSLELNKTDYLKIGDDLEVYVEASDIDSGIKSVTASISGLFMDSKKIELKYNEEKKLYVGKLHITEDYLDKIIDYVSVNVIDNGGKETYESIYTRLYVREFDVDYDNPIVSSVEYNKENLNIGDIFTLTVDAVDEGSGITSVEAGITIGYEYSRYPLIYDETIKKYVVNIEITKEMKYSKIEIASVVVKDKVGNQQYKHLYDYLYILDENGRADDKGPILNNISYSTIVKAGNNIDIIVDAEDELSGIKNIKLVYYGLDNVSEYDSTSHNLVYDESTGKYMVSINTLDEYKYKMLYDAYIIISDNSGNSSLVDIDNIYISDENGVYDDKRPEITSVEFNKDELNVGDTLEIIVNVKDNLSGMPKNLIIYPIVGMMEEPMLLIYDEEAKVYKGKLEIIKYLSGSSIFFGSSVIKDNTGNIGFLNMDKLIPIANSNGEYSKVNTPMINSIKYDKDEYEVGEELIIIVDASSENNSTSKVKLNYYENGKVSRMTSQYDEETGKYIFKIYIDKNLINKGIELESISIETENREIQRSYINTKINVVPKTEKIEMNEETQIDKIVDQIKNTEEKRIEINLQTNEKNANKEIFEAIAGTDKVITFKQEDGTSWTFNGKDIDKNNLKDIKLSLSNKPSEEAKVAINEVDKNPIFIKFDYHGILPGKALVKIKLENYEDLKDKNLTLYYYNEETKSIEKINDNIKVDNNGFVTIEISHCSDYFLSQNPSITTDKDEQDNTTDNNNENKNEDASNSNGEGSTGNSNNGSNNGNPNNGSNSGGVLDSSLSNATSENTNNKNEDELKDLPKTGAVVSSLSYVLIGAFIIVIGLGLTKKRKTLENK